MSEVCEPCTHPQAKYRPGEPSIMGSVKEATCCTIHGRGTCGSMLHIHYCQLHKAAPVLLAAAKELRDAFLAGGGEATKGPKRNRLVKAAAMLDEAISEAERTGHHG